MSERALTVISGGKQTACDDEEAALRRRQLARSGDEFVARLDLASAQQRFDDMLAGQANGAAAVETAVERYEAFVATQAATPIVPPALDQQRSSFEDKFVGGTVKWFDVRRGYGYVVPDNGLPDAHLHVRLLREKGLRLCPENARVVCAIEETARGCTVTEVSIMDLSTAIYPSQFPRRGMPVGLRVSGWSVGTVKSSRLSRGYAVVSFPDGGELLLTIETLNRGGIAYVDPGHTLDVLVGNSDTGPVAVEVRLPNARSVQ